MNVFLNPETVRRPGGKYHHTVKVPSGAEWVAVAGQVGVDLSGTAPPSAREQTKLAMENVLACLAAHGMGKEDLVKITVFLTDAQFVEEFREGRTAVIGEDCQPASTLLIVAGLAAPELLVEIEAWGAKAP